MRNTKRRMVRRGAQVLVWVLLVLTIIAALVFVTQGRDMPVLNPSGVIAEQQFVLIMITVGLGVFVVVPVFILLFTIAWKYRASNATAKYEPELEGNRGLEALWWGVPLAIIFILAIITVVSTRALDPYRALESDVTPVNVQVVSLEWKWLFIYPDYNIATLNYMTIPKDTPINLTLTSDAPMNSFWVPALAGQVYTMTGMSTKLHIMANSVGTFNGASANISGEGYADMSFKVYAQDETTFESWAHKAAASPDTLNGERYAQLAAKGIDTSEKLFTLGDKNLYHNIVMKYMHGPAAPNPTQKPEETHDMHMMEDGHMMEGSSHEGMKI